MNKETFEIIRSNLQAHLDNCKKHLDHIITTEDLTKITVGEFLELKEFANKEYNDMTEIIMVDFYHIIGMGELTVLQTNIVIKLIKEYMVYRSDIKCICDMTDLEHLPELPSKSAFTLHRLGDVTLTSKLRGREDTNTKTTIETAQVLDYKAARLKSRNMKISTDGIIIDGNTINVDTKALKNLALIINPNTKCDNIEFAAVSKKPYCGIKWSWLDNNTIQGEFLKCSIREAITSKIKALNM